MRVTFKDLLATTAIGSVCAIASPAVAQQDAQQVAAESREGAIGEAIIVTGSRVVTNGDAAPTPLTIVTADELVLQSPSNLPDALNKLPQFADLGQGQSAATSPLTNGAANTLNLRSFGAQRNLVLFNGIRVPPTSTDGSVDINVLPQILIQKVDVVTGGASAVYGSDAITGVVNFVVDDTFTGVKTSAQVGTSSREDNDSWKVGVAAGFNMFADERGHFEVAYEHYHSDGLPITESRSAGAAYWVAEGSGTQSNPYNLIRGARIAYGSAGGLIIAGPSSIIGKNFTFDGTLLPFVHGAPTASPPTEIGGDGVLYNMRPILTSLTTDQAYARFDYDFDNVSAYVDFAFSRAKTFNHFVPFWTLGFRGEILSGNPFIPDDVQAELDASQAAGGPSSFRISRIGDRDTGGPLQSTATKTDNYLASLGLEGEVVDGISWMAGLRHGRTEQMVVNTNNINTARFAASTDAVIDPGTGNVVCQVLLTEYADRYSGCVPINLLGPTAPSQGALNYIVEDTSYNLISEQTVVAASISGEPFSTWAGPVRMALSGEYRDQTSTIVSDETTTRADCTGLRANCVVGTQKWLGYAVGPYKAKQNVKEAALEVLVPLLADSPLAQSLELNGAFRFTDYSSSGQVETWKVGLSWQVNDDLRLRATRSRDIRAPSLDDLFNPGSSNLRPLDDIHTNTTGVVELSQTGNPDLKPEIGDTLTIGAVYTPGWLPGFSASVDYYDIKLKDAIQVVSGTSPLVMQQCEDSGGNSQLCELYIRPLPFSDRSPANFPTLVLGQPLNVAEASTRGADFELRYAFGGEGISSSLPGVFSFRLLGSYQPKLDTFDANGPLYAGVRGVSKWRLNFLAKYTAETWSVTVTERWKSGQKVYPDGIYYTIPDIPAFGYTDATVEYKPAFLRSAGASVFFNVQNLFDKDPPIIGGRASTPGFDYPTPNGYDRVGRYYTAGFRAKF